MTADAEAYTLLDALFADAPVGVGFWDRERRYRRVNAALAAMNGVAPEDHVGRRPTELLGRLGRRVEDTIAAVLADGAPRVEVGFDGETPALPGERRHWRASFYPVADADGEWLGVGAVVVEVTREHVAQRERQATSALLDAIFGAAPVGIAFWDPDLRYRRVNDALGVIDGVPAEEHLGRRPDEVLGELGRQIVAVLEQVAERREAIIDHGIEAVLPDGRTQFRQKTVYPVLDERGELAGLAGVVRDVTAQHDAEKERARLLRDALTARAAAEAAQVRAETAHAEAEAARRRMEILARAGERLAIVTRDYESTLDEVARIAVPELADWCAVTLASARGAARTVAVATAQPGDEEDAWALAERLSGRRKTPLGLGRVLRTGEPVLLEEAPAGLFGDVAPPAALAPRSVLVVPLHVSGRAIGAVTLVRSRSERRYGPDDLSLAQSLAARAALAVENARLYTERSHIARTLQESLLPPALPEAPGLELAARYRAAGEENEVGGDFYDVFSVRDGVWNIIIGDVSGKGADAAALTSLTRHTLRAAALRAHDPVANLGLLNDALSARGDPSGRFCTVLYAQVRLDDDGADVTLATGGHLSPLVQRADGRVERARVRGALVGGLREPRFGERRLRLERGDLLLLFTDGVIEMRRQPSAGVEASDAEVQAVLAAAPGAPAEEIVGAVERRAVELQRGEPRDDIALVAVRRSA